MRLVPNPSESVGAPTPAPAPTPVAAPVVPVVPPLPPPPAPVAVAAPVIPTPVAAPVAPTPNVPAPVASTLPVAPAFIEENDQGFENAGDEAFRLPMIQLLQAMSPVVAEEKSDSAGTKYAPGDMLLNSTQEVLFNKNQTATFTPFFHYQQWIAWNHMDPNGGMLARSKDPQGELAKRAARGDKVKNHKGQEVFAVTKYNVFFIVFEGALDEPVALPLKGTKFKKGNLLLGLGLKRGKKYPLYAGKYTLGAVLETNKSKQSYYNVQFENAGWVNEQEYNTCKKHYEDAKTLFDSIELEFSSEEVTPEPVDAEIS